MNFNNLFETIGTTRGELFKALNDAWSQALNPF